MGLKYLYLLIFVLVSIGALIVNGRPSPPESAAGPASSYYFLFPFIATPQEITGIELIIPEQELDLIVTLDENRDWRILNEDFPLVDPAGPQAAQLLLIQMVGMQEIERGEQPMEVFGFLPNPEYVVRFQIDRVISGQNRFTFIVGEKTPQGNGYYVAASPDSTIIDVVPVELIDSLVMVMTQLEPVEADSGAVP